MYQKKKINYLSIFYSFILVCFMHILTKKDLYFLQPYWMLLFFFHWIFKYPEFAKLEFSFILGILTDFFLENTLGFHALAFGIVSFFLIKKYNIFKNFSIFKQSLIIFFFLL
ncbi:rod shape-determining protein MreD [bacterium endosymbiont of Pedicinus badii]|uniref:rod shape-determining protein MreD n=1 Tax=bacterium endosymbiont of Pedicinus badii TaxID=1719126 RepID=UPI0009BACE84|nr:rod shape-determining protein MreD [bacterium endosymbiont of Pedicinus badii]OQM34029.1 hypothetical protein AOQ89_01555 [bacterium endosymbiont of Pedicinus badii]